MINFTFIIPHWNHPSQLKRCVDSIPQRDDIEVIIVDDNSDPNIVDFNKFPCLDYPYVRVIFNKDNKGAGHARNLGLEIAQGKWLVFADCDDFFSEEIDNLLTEQIESNADLTYFNVSCLSENTLEPISDENFDYYKVNIDRAIKENNYSILRYGMNPPWGKIIRHSLVKKNKILFDEVPVANDVMFSVKCGYFAYRVAVNNRVLYCWLINADSLSTLKSLDKCNCHLDTAIRKNKFLQEHALGEFHVNLFKMMKRFTGHGIFVALKSLFKIIMNTNPQYMIGDFLEALNALLKKRLA